jgi:hypothetical protein
VAEFSTDLILVVEQLLPGFLVAWIVYGLTAYSKPAPFERIVQALIFTVLVRGALVPIREFAYVVGRHWREFGFWGQDSDLLASILIGVTMGVGVAWCINHDFPFAILRPKQPLDGKKASLIRRMVNWLRLTEKTIHPSEWYSAFSANSHYVVLHLAGGRRLFGWPVQYPDGPTEGHFLISDVEWLLDSGERVPLHAVKETLVRAIDVEFVEFIYDVEQVSAEQPEIDASFKALVGTYESEPTEGK